MNPVIRFSLTRPVSILMIYAGIVFLGILALPAVRLQHMPDIEYPELIITADTGNLPADETEKSVTSVLRQALIQLRGLESMESESSPGRSVLRLRLCWGDDPEEAAAEAASRIESVYGLLPDSIEKPEIKGRKSSGKLVLLSAGADSEDELARLVPLLKSSLLSLEYIAAAEPIGMPEQKLVIRAEPGRITGSGINIADIASVVSEYLNIRPAGFLDDNGTLIPVSIGAVSTEKEDLGRLSVRGSEGSFRLSDIAGLEFETSPGPLFLSTDFIQQRPCCGLLVEKKAGTGLLNASRMLYRDLPAIVSGYPSLTVKTAFNFSAAASSELRSIAAALAAGCAVLFLLVYAAYRRPGLCLCVTAPVPVCIAAALLFICLSGGSLNTINLTAASIGLGMIADYSIVVADRVCSEEYAGLSAAVESAAPVNAASAATGIIVFIPLLLVPGLSGRIYADMAAVICIFTLSAFISSLTLCPAVYVLVCRSGHRAAPEQGKPLLRMPVGWRKTRLLIWILLTAAAVTAAALSEKTMIPECPENTAEGRIFGNKADIRRFTAFAGLNCIENADSSVLSAGSLSDWHGSGRLSADPQGDSLFYIAEAESPGAAEEFRTVISAAADAFRLRHEKAPPQNPLYRFLASSTGKPAASAESSSLRLSVNPQQAEYYGLSEVQIADELENSLEGIHAGMLRGPVPAEVIVCSDRTADGLVSVSGIPLEQICSIERISSSQLISESSGRETAAAESSRRMVLLFLLAAVFIFITAGIQFGSFSAPLRLMTVLPVSAAGAAGTALILFRQLDIQSAGGILVTCGTAINIWLLLYDLIPEGLHRRHLENYLHCCFPRFLKPAALSVLTTAGAMIPAVLIPGPQNTGASAVMGGLTAAFISAFTLLPLIIIRTGAE